MLVDIYPKLEIDSCRDALGFSEEMSQANANLLNARSDDERAVVLGAWLERYQPCLFGRIAAKKGLISYCFLTEDDLSRNDQHIRDKVQGARTDWTRLAFEGRRSAFVLVAVSPRLIAAKPNAALKDYASHVASLYLLQDVCPDNIYLDEIFLEAPGPGRAIWRWNVGVNYFGSAGDQRWWQDHRIPGGIGFSANSVGHLIKSGQLAEKLTELEQIFGVDSSELVATKIDSLPKALEWAMRTISGASQGPSGKATELLPLSTLDQATSLGCPVTLPLFLRDRNYCEYQGYYHTDITLPSEYFLDAVEKPQAIPKRLDFTYLFDKRVTNPDFVSTASGRRVRSPGFAESSNQKRSRTVPTFGQIADYPRLEAALKSDRARPVTRRHANQP